MIVSGSREASIQAIQAVSIHGTIYYDLIYVHNDEPGRPRQARLGEESIYAGAQTGDKIKVTYLMNVATGIEPLL
jgi:hypothetical protein